MARPFVYPLAHITFAYRQIHHRFLGPHKRAPCSHFSVPLHPHDLFDFVRQLPRRLRPSSLTNNYFSSERPLRWIMDSAVANMTKPTAVRKNVLQEYQWRNGSRLTLFFRCSFRASPTDLLMTPCTAKLRAHKQMRYNKYSQLNCRWPLTRLGRNPGLCSQLLHRDFLRSRMIKRIKILELRKLIDEMWGSLGGIRVGVLLAIL
jgi:Spo12 family